MPPYDPPPYDDAAPALSAGRPLRLALVQTASSTDPADNRARLGTLADEVGEADLVVLPEAFARDFGRPGEVVASEAEPLDGPFVAALSAVARRQGGTWVAGMFETSEDPDRPYNTLVVVDGSGLRASYRKIHLYDSFGFRESDRLRAGATTPVVVDVADVRVGLMTCYDLRFPELGRALVDAGAEVVVVPAAWVAGPRKVRHWETLVTARAIEDVVHVAAVSQPGPRYTGHALAVDPRGDVVGALADGEGLLRVTLDADLVATAREENPSLANRRDWRAGPDVTG